MSDPKCVAILRFVDAYIDEEFAESDKVDFERHLAECERCRQKVQTQANWQHLVKQSAPRESAPEMMKARLMAQVTKQHSQRESVRVWTRRIVPTMAAAAMVVAYFVVPPGNNQVGYSPVTADMISRHQRNVPLEIAGGSDQVRQWYADKVNFPVRPPSFERAIQNAAFNVTNSNNNRAASAKLRGGRLDNLRDRQAAYLVYDVDGAKVSVFVFAPQEMQIQGKRHVQVANHEVFWDDEGGYNVAVYEDRGVGYAIASEMDEQSMINLVSAAVSP